MDKELLEKIETLHNNEEHYSIIELVYSIDESERDYDAISLLARALNNTQNYDEALDHLMYMCHLCYHRGDRFIFHRKWYKA